MKILAIILLVSSSAWAACPLYSHRNNPELDQEIQNICTNIANPISNNVTANQITMNGGLQLSPLTLSQLQALSTKANTIYACSNCSTDVVCVSTGTLHSFVRLSARTTACN